MNKIALTAISSVIAIYGSTLWCEQNLAGPGCCGVTWPTPDSAQVERFMAKDDPGGADPAIQRRAALAVLGARPMESTAWLRLAYADRLAHGNLTDEGQRAVGISYLVLPYAYADAPWRLIFALDNWTQLSPETRMDVIVEIHLVEKNDVLLFATNGKLGLIRSPSGRMTAALLGLIARPAAR